MSVLENMENKMHNTSERRYKTTHERDSELLKWAVYLSPLCVSVFSTLSKRTVGDDGWEVPRTTSGREARPQHGRRGMRPAGRLPCAGDSAVLSQTHVGSLGTTAFCLPWS